MSLHLNQQCQRADAHPPPVRLFRASAGPIKKRHETNARPRSEAASVAVEGHICGAPRAVNRVFCNIVAARLATDPARPSAFARLKIGSRGPGSRTVSC